MRAAASWHPGAVRRLPGLALCAGVAVAALALQHLEAALTGHAWLEAIVLAILVGTVVRIAWTPGTRWQAGIDFSGKMLLEIAVMLLGASVSTAAILAVGLPLLAGIVLLVAAMICGGYGIGRLLGLPVRTAMLVACGNAICGNSAIAAVAPVIDADGDEVAASIAFTAVLGVIVVLLLPLLMMALGLSATQFGVLAGLTVYAVPQVLAATAPVGAMAVQIGTMVKLIRVLMLGPVVFLLALTGSKLCRDAETPPACRPPLHRLVPWFVIGFVLLAALRSFRLLPEMPLLPVVTGTLTVISMGALGLGVDVRMLARAGGRVVAAAGLSLSVLIAAGLGLIRLLGIA